MDGIHHESNNTKEILYFYNDNYPAYVISFVYKRVGTKGKERKTIRE